MGLGENLLSIGLGIGIALSAIFLYERKGPQVLSNPPSLACIGQSWTTSFSGFAPNSELFATCLQCGSNASPITGPVRNDTNNQIVYTNSIGNATQTSIIGAEDFGTWQIYVFDSQGNRSNTLTYTISQSSMC